MSRYTGCRRFDHYPLVTWAGRQMPRKVEVAIVGEGLRCLKTLGSGRMAPGPMSMIRPTAARRAWRASALLECGEPVDSPAVTRAVEWLRALGPDAPGPGGTEGEQGTR